MAATKPKSTPTTILAPPILNPILTKGKTRYRYLQYCFACDCVLELVVCRVRFARVSCPWLRFRVLTVPAYR